MAEASINMLHQQISPNANYAIYCMVMFFDVQRVHLHAKNLVEKVTQLKIADASKPHQKLIPVRIRGVPICVRGVRQKNSHIGRPITHNKVVHIWGLTHTLQDVPYVGDTAEIDHDNLVLDDNIDMHHDGHAKLLE